MKILHIIPAGFNYFDDIKKNAMELAEKQKERGFTVEAFTIQYHGFTAKQSANTFKNTPLMIYSGVFKEQDVMSQLSGYDIVHFHAPFFGIIGKICRMLKHERQNYKIVISYWRNPIISDIFSIFIFIYNRYYIPILSSLSDAQIFLPIGSCARISKWLKNTDNIIDFFDSPNNADNIPLTPAENSLKLDIVNMRVEACINIYNKLINN
jgi:hypothetical protein